MYDRSKIANLIIGVRDMLVSAAVLGPPGNQKIYVALSDDEPPAAPPNGIFVTIVPGVISQREDAQGYGMAGRLLMDAEIHVVVWCPQYKDRSGRDDDRFLQNYGDVGLNPFKTAERIAGALSEKFVPQDDGEPFTLEPMKVLKVLPYSRGGSQGEYIRVEVLLTALIDWRISED